MMRTALIASSLLAVATMQAMACSPIRGPAPTLADRARMADAVFVGRISATKQDRRSRTADYDFSLQKVFAGKVPANLKPWTYTDSAACGMVLRPGYYVFHVTSQQLSSTPVYERREKGWRIGIGQMQGPMSKGAALKMAGKVRSLMR